MFYESNDRLLGSDDDSATIESLTLQISWHVAMVLMHRPFLANCPQSMVDIANQASKTSCNAVSRAIRLYRKKSSFVKAPPFLIYHICRAALAHLQVLSASPPSIRKRCSVTLRDCTQALEEMAVTWPLRATQAVRVVCESAHRWKVIWALPIHLSSPPSGDRSNLKHAEVMTRTTWEDRWVANA
jgi:hypothetical protein